MSENLSQAPVSLCSFAFADARHCRMPIAPNHHFLCAFHARREAQARAAEMVGREVTRCFSGEYVSACDLSSALARVFAAAARGEIKPRTAAILGYLGQNISQTIHLAQDEFINAFGTDHWRDTVRSSFTGTQSDDEPEPKPVKPRNPPATESLPKDGAAYAQKVASKN